MEKNEQSLDVDMLLEILLRLPAKYVGRFLCVSKFWATTIGSRDFVRSYSLREKQPPRLLLAFNTQVKGYQESWYFFSRSCVRDRAPDPVLSTPWSCRKAAEIRRRRAAKLGKKAEPPRAPEVPPDFVSSRVLEFKKQRYKQPCYAHGLMSFLYGDDQVICNPTTGKSLTLPPASVESTEMIVRSFLGYDPINAQYKVLCLTNVTRFCEHQVLTLGSANSNCSWRVIHCSSIVPHFPGTDSVCIGGVLYYTASPCLNMKEPFLVAFDLRSEALEIASMFPEDLESCNGTKLINYHGKVSLVTQTNGGEVYHFYLWVFQDAQKWSKQHLTLRLGVSRSVVRRLEILGTSDLGEIVFAPIHFEDLVIVYYLDQKTNRGTTVFLEGNPNHKFRDFYQVFTFLHYVDSLMLI
uniref:F-box protein n=1 Tax=Noccaea caerulescens TaxID=107243 RepID=A0A1J3K8E2_NOCCA